MTVQGLNFNSYVKRIAVPIFTLTALIVGQAGMISDAQAVEETASALIFSEPYLKTLGHPHTIAYSYSHDTNAPADYGKEFTEDVAVHVRKPTREGGFNSVAIALKSEKRSYELGPFENTSGNPVVMMFLEREMSQMRSRVGGTPVYFRNTIRRAFRDAAEIDDLQVDVGGKMVSAKRVTIRPFVDEKQAARFGKFQGKVFETIVTDSVPGGIYAMRSFIPDQDKAGTNLVTNLLQYQTTEEASK